MEELNPAELSLLFEANKYGIAKATTNYERSLIGKLIEYGYLNRDQAITTQGREALRRQEGRR